MKLYPHQEEALNRTANLNRVAYYHDMGMGKTFTGAEKMARLGAKVNLVICQKSKVSDWVEHFESNYHFKVFNLTKSGQMKDFLGIVAGERFTAVGVINYELAWRREMDLLPLQNFTLMLDESSLIQNKNAKQTKFILMLHPKNVILLSGTPTSGKYENLWTQAHLLGWGISNFLYQQQFVNWTTLRVAGGNYIKVVDKKNPYKNIERLKEKLREYGACFLKTEEVMELPEQTYVEVKTPVSKAYKRFMDDSIVVVDDTELVGDTSLTKRIQARKLCGIYSKEKMDALRDLIESTNDRLVIFYNFTDELTNIELLCEKLNRPVSVINGQIKDLRAYEEHEDSVTLIQYQAGAMGLNLQKANKIIYFTPPERCELWMQSQKRIHRIGQERPCFYYKMVCVGSVEKYIYEALERGVDYTDELFKERFAK